MDVVEIYMGEDGKWWWRRVARNGKIVSVGGEGFVDISGARRAFNRANGCIIDPEIRVLKKDKRNKKPRPGIETGGD